MYSTETYITSNPLGKKKHKLAICKGFFFRLLASMLLLNTTHYFMFIYSLSWIPYNKLTC